MDDKYLPWEEDGIEFLPGDWEIERADVAGLYNYTICGIRGSCSVDGVQLIEWKMAELISYSMLTPWNNSGIEFNGTTEVARDVLDNSEPEAERKYLVFVGKKLMRVNRYFLVKNGYATASDAFKRKVSQQPVRGNKYNKVCKPWVSDDILIPALPSGVASIERGAVEGVYKVKRAIMVTRSAADLVKEGLAVDGYAVKLEEMCESEKLTLSSYKDDTRGFWLCEHPGAVKTLRDIAQLWGDLEKCYDGTLASKIMSHNRDIFVACSKTEQTLDRYEAVFSALDRDFIEHDSLHAQLKDEHDKLKKYANVNINSYLDGYYPIENQFKSVYSRLTELRQQIKGRVETITVELGGADSGDGNADVFPINILPAALQEIMREEYDKIISFKGNFDSKCEELKTRARTYLGKLNTAKNKIDGLYSGYVGVSRAVQSIVSRREELDREKTILDAKLYGKKPMIAQKDKVGRLKFTTKIRIIIEGKDSYTIYDKLGRGPTVTADELIYMGLAERY